MLAIKYWSFAIPAKIVPAYTQMAVRTLAALSLFTFFFFPVETRAQSDESSVDPVAIYSAAQDLHEKNDLDGAIRLYDKALSVLPEFPEAQYQRAVALLAKGQQAEAETGFRRALDLRPDWTLPMTALGSLLVEHGGVEEADRILSKVISVEPNNQTAFAAVVDLRLRAGAEKTVLARLLTQVVNLTTKINATAAIWAARAALELALDKPKDARTSVKNSLAIDATNRGAILQLIEISLIEGDISRAYDLIGRHGSRFEPDILNFHKARVAAGEGRMADALVLLAAIRRPGTAAIELRNRILALRETDVAELENRLNENSKDGAALGRLCVLLRKDNPVKSLQYCRMASELEPGNIGHAVGYAAALVQARKFDAAVTLLRKLAEISPDNATVRANLATALFQLKRLPEARAEFQWLTANQPTAPGAYLFLGIIHDQLGEHLDAMANYQRYIQLAEPVENRIDLEKVNLRLPQLQKLIKKK